MSGKITQLEVQKRSKERVNVYIDGAFAFGLNLVDAARLHTGQELSDTEIADLKARDTTVQAFDRAVRFLAPRPRSTVEVRRRLSEKGTDASVIDEVIDRLQALNYVNDLEFARFWVRNREEFHPLGPSALRYELRQKGIESAIIEEILAELDPQESAYRAAQKKMRSLRGKNRETVRKQLGGFLVRRGFDYETVRTTVDQIVSDLEADAHESFHDEE